jgi:tetratricopeptide (TPR) repeat protein
MMRTPLRSLLAAGAAVTALGVAVATSVRRPVAPQVPAPADTSSTSRSIAYFEKRLTGQPDNYMVETRLISRYLLRFGTGAQLADVERAETLARHLVRTGRPDSGQALSRLSAVLLMQHKFAEALQSASQAHGIDTLNQDALGAVFDAALAAGRYADAESALARLTPGTMTALIRRAQWLDASGQSQGASEAFDRICRQLDRSAAPPAVVAWCLSQLGAVEHARLGPDAAEAVWRRALEVQPGYRGALEGLAAVAAARGAWAQAAALYRRIAADAHPDLYLRLAEAAAARGDRAAERAYERRFLAVAGRPENEALYGEMLALYYAQMSDPSARDAALRLALRDVARRPTVESYDVLSWVRFRRGEFDAALAASDSARRWGTASPTMNYHRGRILEVLGRTTEAAPLLHEAVARWSLLAPHARADFARRARIG